MKICVFLLAELESYDAGRNSKLTCHSLKSCGSVVSVDSLFIVCSPICLKSSVQPAHFLLEQKLEIVIFYRASQKKLSFTGLSICRICRLHFPLAKAMKEASQTISGRQEHLAKQRNLTHNFANLAYADMTFSRGKLSK